MKRLILAALVVAVVGVVAGSALAAGGASTIFDSTDPNGPPTNQPSYGPEAYGFNSLGDQVTFKKGTARSLSSVTVTLSSFACQQGTWLNQSCVTVSGATFSQPMTLTIWNANHTQQLATSSQTFNIPYRPSASPKCPTIDPSRPGGWYQSSSKTCKNGVATDVTFNFSNVTLPETVVYEISYNTSHYGPNPSNVTGPADSLNIAVTDATPSVGTTDDGLWRNGLNDPGFDSGTLAVQFKASNAH